MNERIHAFLDGELPEEALTPDERARAARMRATLKRATGQLMATRAPDLSARVMAALPVPAPAAAPAPARARAPVPAWRQALAWLWEPRRISFSLRPAYGFAGALVAVAALSVLPGPQEARITLPDGPLVRVAERPAQAPPVYVQFRLEAAGAGRVALAGTFTGWKPEYVMQETSPGVWTALVPLRPGVHDYAFVIDGDRWVADPSAPQVDDDFGGKNSRISLPAIEASA